MKVANNHRMCKKNAAVLVVAAALSICSRSQDVVAFAPSSHNVCTGHPFYLKTSLRSLFAINHSDGVNSNSLVIEILTDENREVLLRPSVDPSRPVLVDAFAPWCGPCKLLDKVLKKAQPRYLDRVDFVRWNVNDAENTAQIKSHFIEMGYTLNKLPSLILYRDGQPIAVRPGFANEFQLDNWLETTLPDVLERTFDDNGMKIETLPLSKGAVNGESSLAVAEEKATTVINSGSQAAKGEKVAKHVFSPLDFKARVMTERLRINERYARQSTEVEIQNQHEDITAAEDEVPTECTDETQCWEMVEEAFAWKDRTVIPATSGILLPDRIKA